MLLHNKVNDESGVATKKEKEANIKQRDLINAWMLGLPVGKSLQEDLYLILRNAPLLVEAMVNFSFNNYVFPRGVR